MRVNACARWVVLIAPRASSTLNAWEPLRIGMQALFHDLGITPVTLAAT
jgi:hypothetical protein